jgi:hypothetical protein
VRSSFRSYTRFCMANFKDLFRKASLTLVDGLLLVLCAASLAYFSVPFLAKLGVATGNAVDMHGDIRFVGVVVFLGILFPGVVAVFGATFVIGCLILRMLRSRARLFSRIGLASLLGDASRIGGERQGSSMTDLRPIFVAVLVMATFVSLSVQGQSRESTPVPDHFEFLEGHAYMGGQSVKWEHDHLVLVKRLADMSGKGALPRRKRS